MNKKVTLGGERLGAGKKVKVDLHGYGRSTFNQSRVWRSTAGTGPCYPCFTEIGLNGTTFEMDINILGHTIPTISPLFGSFKLQVDMFACPIRLYQGLLHNNAYNIGLKMKDVLLPTITVGHTNTTSPLAKKMEETSTSSLNNYLGIKGWKRGQNEFNALTHLMYYDIFKNYYANKQEENAKVITTGVEIDLPVYINGIIANGQDVKFEYTDPTDDSLKYSYELSNCPNWQNFNIKLDETKNIKKIDVMFDNGTLGYAYLDENKITKNNDQKPKINTYLYVYDVNGNPRAIAQVWVFENRIVFYSEGGGTQNPISSLLFQKMVYKMEIEDFPLENIDKARRNILKKTEFNTKVELNSDMNFLPYSSNFNNNMLIEGSKLTMQGLVLKTYQNDIFNTWLSTEYIENINGITSILPNQDGEISIDAMILAKKVYNMLNRIAVSGGSYEDWQEATYAEEAINKPESPIYIGGTSAEITFEEVVSTAQTEEQPLATLGGKGILTNKKGGKIVYKCQEPCIIMGIMSITPRVDYYQGNKWYMTEIKTMDDWHKPELDGIGFQNLMANQVVWSEDNNVALAKQPAWIHYQTAVNEVFGLFAGSTNEDDDESLHHMVLRRNYETNEKGEITDFTTYIDPSKFNYAFAENNLTSQNFWIQLGFNVESRRKMAATEIPNL